MTSIYLKMGEKAFILDPGEKVMSSIYLKMEEKTVIFEERVRISLGLLFL